LQITTMSSKGGVGKTTITTELAFWLDRQAARDPEHAADYRYQLADLDGQGGLVHQAGPVDRARITLVDMPGETGDDDPEIARDSDVIVLPMINSGFDRPSTERTLSAIARSGSKALVILVLNHWRSRTTRDRQFASAGMRDWLNGLRKAGSLPKVEAVHLLPDSALFEAISDTHLSVVRQDPRSSAAVATEALCSSVYAAALAGGKPAKYRTWLHDSDVLTSPWMLAVRGGR